MDCQNNLKNTPLHFAAGAGQADAVRLLLRLGADRTIKNAAGYTAEDLVRLAGDENTRKAFKDTQQAASADIATGAKKKISKAPKTDVGLDCHDNLNATPLQDTGAKKKGKKNNLREAIKNLSVQEKKQFVKSSDERKTDGGPGHVSKRSQECGSTPPASSSGQEEEEPRDGAAAGAVGGEDSSRNSQTGSAAGVHVDGETKMRDRKICWNCHDTEDLKRCNGCYMAWYCDKRCQRADRRRHKKFCKKQKRRRMEQPIFYSREDEVD